MNEIEKKIEKHKFIFVDSEKVLTSYHLLKKNKKIFSFNTNLVIKYPKKVFPVDKKNNHNFFTALGIIGYDYSKKIYDILGMKVKDEFVRILVSKFIYNIENTVYNFSLIKNLLKGERALFLLSKVNDNRVNNALYGNIYSLLKTLKNIEVIEVPLSNINIRNIARDPLANIFLRLNFESTKSILYRLVFFFSRYANFFKNKKIYIIKENSLLKEAALDFFLRGFIFLPLRRPKKVFFKNNHSVVKKIKPLFENVFKSYYLKATGYKINNKTMSVILKILISNINEYLTYLKIIKRLNLISAKGKTYLFLGYASTNFDLACLAIAKQKKITSVSFQHAISKEICDNHFLSDITYEVNYTDKFLAYSKASLEYSNKSRFKRGQAIKANLPEDLQNRSKRSSFLSKKKNILFVSTFILTGNRTNPSRAGESDLNKLKVEINLINNVLSKVPKHIHYKPYYSKRFIGRPVEFDIIDNISNISICNQNIDLRYIVSNYKLIITGRATSTFSWCLFSSRPTIFLDFPDNRLNEETKSILKKSLFYFDTRNSNWEKDLLNLLSDDLRNIENIWKKKYNKSSLLLDYLGLNRKKQSMNYYKSLTN